MIYIYYASASSSSSCSYFVLSSESKTANNVNRPLLMTLSNLIVGQNSLHNQGGFLVRCSVFFLTFR